MSDFTPLLNEQLDALGIDLVAVVMAALHTAGRRRIVAEHAEASEPSRR